MKDKLTMRAAICLLAGIQMNAALADLSETIDFNIKPQNLQEALIKYSAQSGVQITSSADIIEGKSSMGVMGNLPARNALARLLEGTELTYAAINENTVTIQIVGFDRSRRTSAAQEGEASLLWNRLAQLNPAAGEEKAGNSTADASAERVELEEVVVTAQKRKETLQDVPISISVVSGADLDRSAADGITEELSRIPGVAASETVQGGGTQLAVRGVTGTGDISGGASPIAYYVDSIPFGFIKSSVLPDPGGYDLERLEVLRGPQGTLYGAGGQGGVVRVLTNDANLNQFEFKARTSVSSTEDGGENYRGDMAINVPIIQDKLAVRAVVGYNDLSGWVDANYPNPFSDFPAPFPDPSLAGTRFKDDVNDAELANFRFKLNARPTENLSLELFAWLSRQDYGWPSVSSDDRTTISAYGSPISTDFSAYGLTVGYEFPAFSVTSSTSYIDYSNKIDQDITGVGFNGRFFQIFDSEVLSEEILFSSRNEGSWEWSLGLFYRDVEDGDHRAFIPSLESYSVYPVPDISTSESYAVFGELSRRFFHDQLKLSLGLRNFHDRATTTAPEISRAPSNEPPLPAVAEEDKYHATTPRAVLTWFPSKDLTLYASYAQGFKSGVQQGSSTFQIAPNAQSAEPDLLTNYEVGMKGNLLEGRLSFETAVYYMDWQDKLAIYGVDFGQGIVGAGFTNGKSASGLGADFALTTRLVEGLEVGATFSWNDLTQDGDVRDANNNVVSVKGDRIPRSPERTVGGFAEYAFPIGASGFEGRLSGAVNYTSPQGQILLTRLVEGDSLLVSRAALSIDAPSHWTATIYGENLNDERGAVNAGNSTSWQPRIRPRTVGLQLEVRY